METKDQGPAPRDASAIKNDGVQTYVDDVSQAMAGKGPAVQTYVSDITKAVEGNQGGIVKKMIEEQEAYEAAKKNSSGRSARNGLFIILGILLIGAAVVGAYLIWKRTEGLKTVAVAPQYQSLIFTDHAEPAPIDGLDPAGIAGSIRSLVKTTTIKPGGVEGIYPTVGGTIIGLREFISLIGAGLPIDTMPFVNENFLLGAVYYIDSGVPTLHSKEIATTPLPSPVPVVVEGKPVTLESSAFFKTGTTEFINADAKDKAEAAISLFLTDIDFTTTEINVVGTYSVERPSSKNDALAESRRKLGLDILNEVLTATYAPEDIAQMTITSSAKGVSLKDTHTDEEIKAMTAQEKNSLLDAAQGIQYSAQAKTKSMTMPAPVPDGAATVTDSDTGKISDSTGISFFMLLNERSFADVFDGMRAWEPKMFSDVHGFLGIGVTDANSYLLTKPFEDGVVQNRNARVLYDNAGNVVLLYSFADDNSVLITDTESATREIILRLASAQKKK